MPHLPRPTRQGLAQDDRGIAGAVGLIIMLAVAVTAYADTVRTKIPEYGEETEAAWDAAVGTAFRDVGRSVVDAVLGAAPAATVIPPPPQPRSIDLPFLGRAAPVPASGSVRFVTGCADATVSHQRGNGEIVEDLRGGPRGCIVFSSAPVYSAPFGYVYELGGVLRLQAGRAVVLSGPSLELGATSPTEYRVALSLPALRGEAVGVSLDDSSAHLDVVPGPSSAEVEQAPNSARATWIFETAHPAAWKTWYETRFLGAGFVPVRSNPGAGESSADFTVACIPAACTLDASGTGTVDVRIEGPRTDVEDIRLSITYGLADIQLR